MPSACYVVSMTSEAGGHYDIDQALGALPLFPLPQAVLFPGAVLPLHVFEPRYKAMIRDCLASHKTLSVVQIIDGEHTDDHGHPKIAKVAGVGVIVDHAELSEGRFNILVRGKARVQLEELPFVPPYRTAKATILHTDERHIAEADITALLANATGFVTLVRERDHDFDFRLPKDAPPGFITDVCAHHLIIDAAQRQHILETLDLTQRVMLVTEALALQRLALTKNDHELN
jgi:Lon protease-like protein